MASIAPSATADAQQPSAQASVAITVRVQPVLAIRGVAVAPSRAAEPRERVEAVSVVDVESNLPYRVAVRLAPAARGARVFVRSASGAFEPLGPNGSVVVAASRIPGRHAHEVRCRADAMPADALDAGRCALVYELSAEYHDSLLRTTAAPAAPVTPATLAAAETAAGR
jgi:hypothetical protein